MCVSRATPGFNQLGNESNTDSLVLRALDVSSCEFDSTLADAKFVSPLVHADVIDDILVDDACSVLVMQVYKWGQLFRSRRVLN